MNCLRPEEAERQAAGSWPADISKMRIACIGRGFQPIMSLINVVECINIVYLIKRSWHLFCRLPKRAVNYFLI